jgi:endonuclease/exonuclease/phosphatase family metal-dependent hydrolase
MKLISLNIWGGRAYEPLIAFLKTRAADTDIFCFQEVLRTSSDRITLGNIHLNIYEDIKAILFDHVGYYVSSEDNYAEGPTDFPLQFGQAMFIKKSIAVAAAKNVFIHKHHGAGRSEIGRSAPRALQHVSFIHNDKQYTVFNYHGLHNGLGKEDSDERLEQSKKIYDLMAMTEGSKILCGDLNLLPTTQSLVILENGMRNLIKEHGVTSTRSSFYKKEGLFADYILVSDDVSVDIFSVLEDEVSDHLAMYLNFK